MNEKYSGKAILTLDGPYGSFTLELDEYEIDKPFPHGTTTTVHATTKKDMQYTSKSASPLASAAAHANCKCSPVTLTKLTYKNDCKICERNAAMGEHPIETHPMRLFNAMNQNYLCLQHYAEHAAYLKKMGLICSDNSSDKDECD